MLVAMELTRTQVPLGEYVPTADQVIVIDGLSWEGFETLLALRGERCRPKVAYLDGVLELMGTSRWHEKIKGNIGRLVEVFCLHHAIPYSTYGNWLQKQQAKEAGIEPDECYIFDPDPVLKDKPDLAIDVVWTSGGLSKLEIYRRLGVREVWFWQNEVISVHVLGERGYTAVPSSELLPSIDLALVARLAMVEPTSTAVTEFRASLG